MTIDPLGISTAGRPERSHVAESTVTNAGRVPAAPARTTAMNSAAGSGASPATPGSMDDLKDAVSKLNASVHAQSLEFEIDEDSKRTIVKVIDSTTREVVRQLPTEEALQIAKAIDKAFGLLIRQQA